MAATTADCRALTSRGNPAAAAQREAFAASPAGELGAFDQRRFAFDPAPLEIDLIRLLDL